MAIKIMFKRSSEDGKVAEEEVILKEGEQTSCLDSEIVFTEIPVKCKSCGENNSLIAEDFEIDESHERGDTIESCHSSHAYGECEKCNKDMELKISLWEYPEGALSFEKDFIEEIENCEYIKDSK